MVSRHDMPDMRTLDEVSSAPEEPLPPPWVLDGAAIALAEPSATSPPLGLSGVATAWWRATVEEFELEPHHVRTLSEAAFAWDRCQQARSLVNQQARSAGPVRPVTAAPRCRHRARQPARVSPSDASPGFGYSATRYEASRTHITTHRSSSPSRPNRRSCAEQQPHRCADRARLAALTW
jgi:hypothetical protein